MRARSGSPIRSARFLVLALTVVMLAFFVLTPVPARAATLEIAVNYAQDWVAGQTDADVTVSVSVLDSVGTLKADAEVAADSAGDFFVACDDWFAGTCPDIVPGDKVLVHVLGADASVDPVGEITGALDAAENTVSGNLFADWFDGPLDVSCEVWQEDGPAPVVTSADTAGDPYLCDFDTVAWDLQFGQQVAVRYLEPDGDSVYNVFQWPVIRAQALSDDVWGHNFAGPVTITVTESDGSTVKGIAGPIPIDSGGNFGLNVAGEVDPSIDLVTGDQVFVDDGTTEKSLQVSGLRIDAVDTDADTVAGYAPADHPNVSVWINSPFGFWLGRGEGLTELGGGDFLADFALLFAHIEPGTEGDSSDCDAEDDCTHAHWYAPNPQFAVNPATGNLWGWQWEAGSQVEITLPGEDPFLADTDPGGSFGVGISRLTAGQTVTVAQGAFTKTHTVTSLRITGVDPDLDEMYGTAAAASDVFTNIHGRPVEDSVVTADGEGSWTASFPGEIEPDTSLYAYQVDGDGDRTWMDWPPANHFAVDPQHDQVNGWNWNAYGSVTLRVFDPDDPNEPLFEQTGIAAFDDWGNWGTNLDPEGTGAFDVQPGHLVRVIDEAGTLPTKETLVNLLTLDEPVVAGATTLTGAADQYIGDVSAAIHDETGAEEGVVEFVAYGLWEATFSTTFEPGTQGSVSQVEQGTNDGDRTEIWWHVPNPTITVDPLTDSVWGNDFAPHVPVDITVDSAPLQVWGAPTDALGNFGIGIPHDIQIGDEVTVTATVGDITKSHIVLPLALTGVDQDNDLVVGTAWFESTVFVNQHNRPEPDLMVAADVDQGDGIGQWTADFNGLVDIGPDTNGYARQFDDDGDQTWINWPPPPPEQSFNVFVDQGLVHGYQWPDGTDVTMTLEGNRGAGVVELYSGMQTSGPAPWDESQTFVEFQLPGDLGFQPGDLVTLDGGGIIKDHTVIDFDFTVDPDADTVSGTVPPFADVGVGIHDEAGPGRHEIADGSGGFSADFSIQGDEDWETVIYDITEDTSGDVSVNDGDGDNTTRSFGPPPPPEYHFNVDVAGNGVWGHGWSPGQVEVTVAGAGPFVVDVAGEGDPDGRQPGDFNLDLNSLDPPIDVAVGDEVEVTHTDADETKSHVATGLQAGHDPVSNNVNVTAEVDSFFDIWVHDTDPWVQRHGQIPAGGTLSVDFSDPGGNPGEEETIELAAGNNGAANQCDADGDCTFAFWRVINPSMTVFTADNAVVGVDWPEGASVTMTVDGKPECTDTQTAGPSGDMFTHNVIFDMTGCIIVPGDLVALGNGDIQRTHVVRDLRVTSIDMAADTIAGTTDLSDTVTVWIPDGPALRLGVPVVGGAWLADLSVEPGPDEGFGTFDIVYGSTGLVGAGDEGGETVVNWEAVAPASVAVDVEPLVFEGGPAVAVVVFDPATGDYTVQVRGETTGGPLLGVFGLGSAYTSTDLEVTPDGGLAVLGTRPDTGTVRVRLIDPATGIGTTFNYGNVYSGDDLEVTPDGDLAVLGTRDTGAVRVRLIDPAGGSSSYSFGKVYSGDDLEITPDGDLAVLGARTTGAVRVRVIDPATKTGTSFTYGKIYSGDDLEITPDGDLAVLGTHPGNDTVRVRVTDPATKAATTFSYGKLYTGDDLEITATGGLAVLGTRPDTGRIRVRVVDPTAGTATPIYYN